MGRRSHDTHCGLSRQPGRRPTCLSTNSLHREPPAETMRLFFLSRQRSVLDRSLWLGPPCQGGC